MNFLPDLVMGPDWVDAWLLRPAVSVAFYGLLFFKVLLPAVWFVWRYFATNKSTTASVDYRTNQQFMTITDEAERRQFQDEHYGSSRKTGWSRMRAWFCGQRDRWIKDPLYKKSEVDQRYRV